MHSSVNPQHTVAAVRFISLTFPIFGTGINGNTQVAGTPAQFKQTNNFWKALCVKACVLCILTREKLDETKI